MAWPGGWLAGSPGIGKDLSFSVHPAITTQLLAAFPTDSAEGIEGTAVRFLKLKCPFGKKSSHFTAVQHCLNRALWQTVEPFSFPITILV